MAPSDASDLSRFRLVEMFTNYTDDDVKAQIISSFTSESPLRIVGATEAFGLGLDCADICPLQCLQPSFFSNFTEIGT